MDIASLTFTHPISLYVLSATLGALGVRTISAALRASERPQEFIPTFKTAFRGYGAPSNNTHTDDYFQTFYLGVLELCIYPVFLSLDKPEYVGAWIGLKVLPQWKFWSEHRHIYNRFLILNALIVVLSYVLAKQFLSAA